VFEVCEDGSRRRYVGLGDVLDESYVVAATECRLDTALEFEMGWEERLFDPRLRGRLRMRLRLCVCPIMVFRQ